MLVTIILFGVVALIIIVVSWYVSRITGEGVNEI